MERKGRQGSQFASLLASRLEKPMGLLHNKKWTDHQVQVFDVLFFVVVINTDFFSACFINFVLLLDRPHDHRASMAANLRQMMRSQSQSQWRWQRSLREYAPTSAATGAAAGAEPAKRSRRSSMKSEAVLEAAIATKPSRAKRMSVSGVGAVAAATACRENNVNRRRSSVIGEACLPKAKERKLSVAADNVPQERILRRPSVAEKPRKSSSRPPGKRLSKALLSIPSLRGGSSRASSARSATDDIVLIDGEDAPYWAEFVSYCRDREETTLVAAFEGSQARSRARVVDWILELILYFKVTS